MKQDFDFGFSREGIQLQSLLYDPDTDILSHIPDFQNFLYGCIPEKRFFISLLLFHAWLQLPYRYIDVASLTYKLLTLDVLDDSYTKSFDNAVESKLFKTQVASNSSMSLFDQLINDNPDLSPAFLQTVLTDDAQAFNSLLNETALDSEYNVNTYTVQLIDFCILLRAINCAKLVKSQEPTLSFITTCLKADEAASFINEYDLDTGPDDPIDTDTITHNMWFLHQHRFLLEKDSVWKHINHECLLLPLVLLPDNASALYFPYHIAPFVRIELFNTPKDYSLYEETAEICHEFWENDFSRAFSFNEHYQEVHNIIFTHLGKAAIHSEYNFKEFCDVSFRLLATNTLRPSDLAGTLVEYPDFGAILMERGIKASIPKHADFVMFAPFLDDSTLNEMMNKPNLRVFRDRFFNISLEELKDDNYHFSRLCWDPRFSLYFGFALFDDDVPKLAELLNGTTLATLDYNFRYFTVSLVDRVCQYGSNHCFNFLTFNGIEPKKPFLFSLWGRSPYIIRCALNKYDTVLPLRNLLIGVYEFHRLFLVSYILDKYESLKDEIFNGYKIFTKNMIPLRYYNPCIKLGYANYMHMFGERIPLLSDQLGYYMDEVLFRQIRAMY